SKPPALIVAKNESAKSPGTWKPSAVLARSNSPALLTMVSKTVPPAVTDRVPVPVTVSPVSVLKLTSWGPAAITIRMMFSPAWVSAAIFDRDVKACIFQILANRGQEMRRVAEWPGANVADHRNRGLLRAGHERPRCCRAADRGWKFSPSQGD